MSNSLVGVEGSLKFECDVQQFFWSRLVNEKSWGACLESELEVRKT